MTKPKTPRPRGRPKSAAPKSVALLVRFSPEEINLIDRKIKDLDPISRDPTSRQEMIRMLVWALAGAKESEAAELWTMQAGAKFHIGGVMAKPRDDLVERDFGRQSWVEVKNWQAMGGDAPENKFRFWITKTDRGQLACIAAEESTDSFVFRITFPSGAERVFSGVVASARKFGKGAGSYLQINISRDSNVVKIAEKR